MFIGHYAVALGTKKAAPKISLGTLFIAAQFLDLLWPLFLLLGIEHVRIEPGNTPFTPLDFYDYPLTHSLAGAILWSLVLGAVYFAIRRNRNNALIVGAVVFSHWILDFLTHRADLPLWFSGSLKVGLGLWYSVAGTIMVEGGIFIAGIFLYLRATKAKDKIGTYGFWGLAAVLAGSYFGSSFGPPPPNVGTLAIAGNAMWLFVLWGYWIDRHRISATETDTGL
ncbi:MAG: hypothetical protein KGJ59_02135 [Bacteroidota bacterium]|nr:hypothetical protein [Bacteroidota bacterium]